jgi:uncharacterized protein YdaU (DUF1376 family)
LNWYPRFPGDYIRDTAHLSLTEHGAYNVLLDHYYATGEPLPAEEPALMRICRAFEDHERAAVTMVARLFFPVNGDGKRHNKRADKQLVEMAEKQTKLSEAGKRGMAKRWQSKPDKVVSKVVSNEPIAYPHPHPHPHPEPEARKIDMTGKPVVCVAFDRFWKAYPNKKGKKDAAKAFAKAKDLPPIDELVAEVELQSRSDEWRKDNGQFIPHPATWLNRGGWMDEVTVKE